MKILKHPVSIKQMKPQGWERTYYNHIVGREEVEDHQAAAEALNATKAEAERFCEVLGANIVTVIEWSPCNWVGEAVVKALQEPSK